MPSERLDALGVTTYLPHGTLESGSSPFDNQVGWARYYLVRGGYIDASRRGVWTLTEKGRKTAPLSDAEITALVRHVVAEWGTRQNDTDESEREISEEASPGELSSDYRTQLLSTLQALPPSGFERLCQRLLREAGFEQVTVTGRSGDGGIDGIGILELNAFVSFKVLFQCKRYELLARTGDRLSARLEVQGEVDAVVRDWMGRRDTE